MLTNSIYKKIISFMLVLSVCVISVFCFPGEAKAATAQSTAGRVAVSYGRLNVRSSPSASSAIITSLPKDSYITLISKDGSWWKVEYSAGKYGYCSSSYISPLTGSKALYVATSGGNLNVRTGPSSSYAIKHKLANGSVAVALSEHGDFTRILYNGINTGYVSNRYLKSYSNTGSSSVKLSVPDYKQTDSRWANTILGSSGKTLGQIGCTTTALAMTESYRTGTTVTPYSMSKKLKYSSSGSLYWPSNYTFVTNPDSYLYTIRGLLRQGKPVILGCKKSNGSQHWIVVTGYNGRAVTPSNFYINDPGSKNRTTLSQFLDLYPNFYKIAYYM